MTQPLKVLSILPGAVVLAALASCGDLVIGNDFGPFVDTRFEASASFSYSIPAEARSRIRVDAINGSIELRSAPNVDRISITGRRIVGAETRARAQQILDDIRVDVGEFADQVTVRTVQPNNPQGRRYEVDYEIVVPESFRIDLDQTNGSIDLFGPFREADATNVNGTVFIQDISNELVAVVVNGNVDADVLLVGGDVSLSTTNGNVTLGLPAASSAVLTAQVLNGSISLSGLTLSGQVITQQTLKGTLGAGLYNVDLKTVNGNVAIAAN